MKRFFYLLVAIVSFSLMVSALSGCGSLSVQSTSGTGFALQATTMKYIERVQTKEQRNQRALRLIDAVRDARTMIDFQGVSVDDLKAAMMIRIIESDLEPSDKFLLTNLVDMVQVDVEAGQESGSIPEGSRITVNAALDSIERAASFYLTDSAWSGAWQR